MRSKVEHAIGVVKRVFGFQKVRYRGLAKNLHRGLLNYEGYYDSLIAFIDHSVEEGFLRPRHRAALIVDTDMTKLIERLAG